MHLQKSERGSATAELVVALPLLVGIRFLGGAIESERLRYVAAGIVQAVIRDESSSAINRELAKALPDARYWISEGGDGPEGEFVVTLRHRAASASARGYR